MNRADLQNKLYKEGLKVTGSTKELRNRLLEFESNDADPAKHNSSPSKTVVKPIKIEHSRRMVHTKPLPVIHQAKTITRITDNKIFIDIETTGIPIREFNLYHPPNELTFYDSSRIVEIGYIVYDKHNSIVKEYSSLIKPCGFTIKNSYIHGVTQETAQKEGKNILDVLNIFYTDLEKANMIISHNINFDINVLLSECYRNKLNKLCDKVNHTLTKCTMKIGKSMMNTQKNPKLTELYTFLFGESIDHKHRALADAKICAECYYKLAKIKDQILMVI